MHQEYDFRNRKMYPHVETGAISKDTYVILTKKKKSFFVKPIASSLYYESKNYSKIPNHRF